MPWRSELGVELVRFALALGHDLVEADGGCGLAVAAPAGASRTRSSTVAPGATVS